MSKCGSLGPWVKRFLLDHLIEERNLSRNTQRSYRDTLALLMPYAATERNKPVDRLDVFDLSSDVQRGFLDHLEQSRRCSIRTRNQRLAAVHAMARFIAERSPEHIAWCGQIRAVPFKRFARNELSYMNKPEMDAILAAPDRRTEQGRRDHALLLFLYNSGARVSEAASLLIADLNLRPNQLGDVQLRGKGRKIRRCPLWPATVNALLALVRNRSPDEPVFLNRLGDAITRHGIHWMLRSHVRAASASHPSLLRRPISPHTIRHTTATHLLRSGVDINTIRASIHDPRAAARLAENPAPIMPPPSEAETEEQAEERKQQHEQERKEYEAEQERRAEQFRQETKKREQEYEAEQLRREEQRKARAATFERILVNAPATLSDAQLRVLLRALVNLDPYTFADDLAEDIAADNENEQRSAEEVLLSTIDATADDKLTRFALRLALAPHVGIPREGEFDFLTEAEGVFAPPEQKKKATPKKTKQPTPVESAAKPTRKAKVQKATSGKKKIAA